MRSIFSFIAVILSLNVFSQGEWQYLSPWPTINNLFDVYFITPQKGWMVGSEGTVVETSDGGETWQIQYKDDDKYFTGVFFIDENEGWVIGWHDVLHTADGGINWEEQDLPGFLDVEAITFINPDTGWIVGTYNTIYKTEDGGENWEQKLSGSPNAPMLNDVYFSDALHGIAVGGFWFTPDEEAIILLTDDGGETWQDTLPTGIKEITALSFISPDTGWACSYGQEVLKTNNGGEAWEVISEIDNFNHDIHFFDQYNGRVLRYSSIYSTIDGGINWTENNIAGGSFLNAFSFSGTEGFAGGFDGAMYKSEDYGMSWHYMGSEPFSDIECVYFADSLNGWAKNFYSHFLSKTENGGLNWDVVDIGSSELLADLYFLNSSTGYALGYYDSLYKTTDSGETWNALSIGVEGTFICVHFISEQIGFIGGNDAVLLRTTDGGLNWEEVYLSNYGAFVDIDFTDDQNGWVINSGMGAVYHTIDSGETWLSQGIAGSGNLDDILMINDQKGFVTSLLGYIYMTEDGGNNWEVVCNTSPNSNRIRIEFIDENEGWFFRSSILYYSIDGGSSWNSYGFMHSMTDICFIENKYGWIFGSNSLMYKYHDLSTGITEKERAELAVFPNPVSDILTIQLPCTMTDRDIINIFDISGKLIMNRQIKNNMSIVQLDVSFLPDGMYIMEYKNRTQRQTTKFLKHD
jgi:photosystem II stability/assembly factor-like uncharacterized protein